MFKKEEKKKEIKESVAEPKAKPAAAAAAADAIISAMPDALIVLDLNGVIVNVNPAMTKMFGFKPEERIGKSFNELGDSIEAEDIERFMKLLGELIETGHVEPIETVIRAKDGREIPTSVVYSLIKDADGNPKNIVAVLRDITELKKAEEEKVAALKKAADIMDIIVDQVIVTDFEGKIISVNEALERTSGYKKEEVIGESALKFTRPEEVEKNMKILEEVLKKGRAGPIETIGVDKDGKENPVSFTIALLKDAAGKPSALVSVARDITELKRAEEERVAVFKIATDTIDAMSDGVVLGNMDGEITFVNPALEKMGGYKKSELVGKNVADLMSKWTKPEDMEKHMEGLRTILEGKVPTPLTLTLVSKDGRDIPIILTMSFIKDAKGKPTTIVTVLRDISDIKRVEEKRIEAEKKAARIEEAKKYSKELEAKVKDLEEFRDLAVGRELKMKKMEEEMGELKKKLKGKGKGE